ncbi:MAG: nitroreductase family protein [Anaerolineae bacterium]
MYFNEVVEKRRTVREFQSKLVEEEKLLRVLAAGLKAPSHNHLREWEFILMKDFEQRKRVVDLGVMAKDFSEEEIEEATEPMTDWEKEAYLKALPVQRRMLMSSPDLLIVCFRMRKSFKECEILYELNDFASVWACIENILLAMAAEGLYGVTFIIPHETVPLKKMLGIPDDYEVAALIPIGYPQEYFVKQKPVSLKEKIHYNKW